MTGLRELQRRRVHEAISAAAIALFLERGFDEVPVTEIAAAAGVSKPTLFKYFPAKEDLVLHRIADHRGEAARVVRERAAGERPLEALRRHFLDGLARRDPVTGLNDDPEVLAFHRMVFTTPSLLARLFQHISQDEQALAEALTETHAGVGTEVPTETRTGARTGVPSESHGGARTAAPSEIPGGAPTEEPAGALAEAPAGALGETPDGTGGELTAGLLAAQVLAAQRVLARRNWRMLAQGRPMAEVEPEAVRAAERAFSMLEASF
ncbi:TetR family transcriptional regulator [Nonomuraea aridisoli]|uniref:TetR family transcriptional regulator n=1 Tax=Nonomuraea aridisoli TaxID=2070368 RepID=UPI001F46DDEC|nr:TetR family transcriptional regulator [Nonomuraea aridisoli]